MKRYDLKTCSPFINPTWLRQSMGLNKFETIVLNNKVVINEKELVLVDNLTDNTSVLVSFDGNFYCYLKSDYEIWKQEKDVKLQEEKNRRIETQKFLKEKADEYYKNLSLPFKYNVCHKDNLSGLSANSWGDGRKNNTVEHILVNEDIKIGKLIRSKGDFLCTTKSGSNGKHWVDNNQSLYYFSNEKDECEKYTPVITCKSCLKIIAKLC